MDDREKIQSFGDMVNAADKLAAPWRKANLVLTVALMVTNLFWAIVLAIFIWFAYMTPMSAEQTQDMPDGTQSQSFSQRAQGVTDGK